MAILFLAHDAGEVGVMKFHHACCDEADLFLLFQSNQWRFDVDCVEKLGHFEITYCPWCGELLPREPKPLEIQTKTLG